MTTLIRAISAFLFVVSAACTESPAPVASTAVPAAPVCPDSAQQFWTKFREAVLKGDFDAVAAMTHFPLEIYGDGDNSPKKFVSRKNFKKRFSYLLDLDMYGNEYEPNPKPVPKTMREFAKAVTRLPRCGTDGDYFYLGKWIFLLKPEGWRLIAIHSNEFISMETEEPLHTTPIGK